MLLEREKKVTRKQKKKRRKGFGDQKSFNSMVFKLRFPAQGQNDPSECWGPNGRTFMVQCNLNMHRESVYPSGLEETDDDSGTTTFKTSSWTLMYYTQHSPFHFYLTHSNATFYYIQTHQPLWGINLRFGS